MIPERNQIPKQKLWAYFILTSRFLLAFVFLNYGIGKLTGSQFGLNETELTTPIKELSLFRVSWYLFDHQPFKTIIGIAQIICATLLTFRRTSILGAFMFLPIVSTILIIDISFMPPNLAYGFTWRLSFYILLDLLILYSHKEKMKVIWHTVWKNMQTKLHFPLWAYLLLPISALLLEFSIAIPKTLTALVFSPSKTLPQIYNVFKSFAEYF
jgi:uncharacterized membrane protein YphA (DoxX/SURF4 family)